MPLVFCFIIWSRRGPALSAVRSTKKRSRAALLIPLAFIALDCGLRLWSAESIPGGLLSVAGAIIWFVLEIRGYGVRSWIDEEIKPRKGEGKGGLPLVSGRVTTWVCEQTTVDNQQLHQLL